MLTQRKIYSKWYLENIQPKKDNYGGSVFTFCIKPAAFLYRLKRFDFFNPSYNAGKI